MSKYGQYSQPMKSTLADVCRGYEANLLASVWEMANGKWRQSEHFW